TTGQYKVHFTEKQCPTATCTPPRPLGQVHVIETEQLDVAQVPHLGGREQWHPAHPIRDTTVIFDQFTGTDVGHIYVYCFILTHRACFQSSDALPQWSTHHLCIHISSKVLDLLHVLDQTEVHVQSILLG
ncbi:MAG: hypothetical protein KGI08_11320, partial [Thaumarchaeota archaeon]|nr:hypothetical protein [Nitrososphaerota archaeon]